MEISYRFALDIGGTLSKLAYVDETPPECDLDFLSSVGTVHLRIFNNSQISDLISYMQLKNFSEPILPITGGGAYKYSTLFETSLSTTVHKVDEIESLFTGFKVVMREVTTPAFKFTFSQGKTLVNPLPLPSMLCNIGSGVSICKIGERIERLTGSCLGGGSVLGLATMMLGVQSYDELLDLCNSGNANNVDTLYSDIDRDNGTDTLAVSLGKLALQPRKDFRREDIAKSLLNMVAYNIANVAYLAGKLQKLNQVCFVGNFIRGYDYTMDRISFAMNYWSEGTAEALFLKHDGYFGALGALFEKSQII